MTDAEKQAAADSLVVYLNRVMAAAPDFARSMAGVKHAVPADAAHALGLPAARVGDSETRYSSALGLINGFLGTAAGGEFRIQAILGSDGRIERFQRNEGRG